MFPKPNRRAAINPYRLYVTAKQKRPIGSQLCVADDVPNSAIQSLGDPYQCVNGWILLSTFDSAHEVAVAVYYFRKLFL